MTVTTVLGYGVQFYRDSPVPVTLLPKLKVERIVSRIPVADVIHTMKKDLLTGRLETLKLPSPR